MPRINEQIDEHILAAFLSGDLPASLRREIAAYIAHSERARDLLSMANDALEEVESGDGRIGRRNRTSSIRPYVPTETESLEPDRDRQFWKVATLFASSILILAITVGLFAYDYRSHAVQSAGMDWKPTVGSENIELSWPGQREATSYQIMVQNQDSGVSSLLSRTQKTSFNISTDEFAFASRTPYQVWILAVDSEEHVLGKSEPITILNRN